MQLWDKVPVKMSGRWSAQLRFGKRTSIMYCLPEAQMIKGDSWENTVFTTLLKLKKRENQQCATYVRWQYGIRWDFITHVIASIRVLEEQCHLNAYQTHQIIKMCLSAETRKAKYRGCLLNTSCIKEVLFLGKIFIFVIQ